MTTVKILVNQATYDILVETAEMLGDKLTGGRRMTNGQMEIEISRETRIRLREHTLPGETIDDVIARIAAKGKGLN